MSNTLSVKNIRNDFGNAIKNAESGVTTVITRYGKPVARLAPIESERPKFPDLSEFRKSIKIKGKPLGETVSQMRDQERF